MNLSPQDFKALLSSLDRISQAIEGKSGNCAVEVVNRFSKVFRMLKASQNILTYEGLAAYILIIQKTYVKIANDVMSEDQNE